MILPRRIVKLKMIRGCPPVAHTAPAAPSTSASCAVRARLEKVPFLVEAGVVERTGGDPCGRLSLGLSILLQCEEKCQDERTNKEEYQGMGRTRS